MCGSNMPAAIATGPAEDARDLRPRAVETAASQGFWRRLGANAVALPYTNSHKG